MICQHLQAALDDSGLARSPADSARCLKPRLLPLSLRSAARATLLLVDN